jgi:hypothetical protein
MLMISSIKRRFVARIIPIICASSLLYFLLSYNDLVDVVTIEQNVLNTIQTIESDSTSKATDVEYFGTCDTVRKDFNPASSYLNNNTKNTVIGWEGVDGMQKMAEQGSSGNLLCEIIDKARSNAQDSNLPITVNITFSCRELFYKSGYGTGNYLVLIYGMRLAAHVYGNVELYITCTDAEETKKDLIIPWVTGWFPARPISRNSSVPLNIQEACVKSGQLPIGFLNNEIQYDLRRMAIGLMGVPSLSHPSALFAEKNLWLHDVSESKITSPTGGCLTLPFPRRDETPPYPSSAYTLDDAVIHFRCGDLMNSINPYFSFLKFDGYTRHISPDAKTIGIITQSFDADSQSRDADDTQITRDRCRIVVTSLIEYLKVHYPNAQVNLHNSVSETIALTFARMIMANQTIGALSSFSLMPTLSTFGLGYFRPWGGDNHWLRIDEFTSNVILFQERRIIKVKDMKSLWETKGEEGVLKWFWN